MYKYISGRATANVSKEQEREQKLRELKRKKEKERRLEGFSNLTKHPLSKKRRNQGCENRDQLFNPGDMSRVGRGGGVTTGEALTILKCLCMWI